MPLILRKCSYDGYSSRNFYYGKTGEIVTAPDWNPIPYCGNGLHGLLEGNGAWSLLEGDEWLVIEANEEDIVNIDDNKCKFSTGKIVFRGTDTELANSEFPHKFNLDENSAYHWAYFIGNRDIMINKIYSSKWAYWWARYIGNRDVMIEKIKLESYAYEWAINIGDRDIMKSTIVSKHMIGYWNMSFGLDNMICR